MRSTTRRTPCTPSPPCARRCSRCGDDDLFRFKVERRGRWSYRAEQPDTVPADDPVLAGLRYLRGLHDERHWLAPSELLDRIARDRRALELGFAEGRPRDVWRRLRFVIDQARAWSDATGGSLRGYLHWVEQQTAAGARVEEAILPETDDDAVRIMTIHAAKGLEFPITIVSGMSTVPQERRAAAEVVFPPTGGVGYRFGKHVQTEEWASWAPIDEQMGLHERIRLLYVACTRACDHLVVSLHRKARKNPPDSPSKRTNAELLVDGMGPLLDECPTPPTHSARRRRRSERRRRRSRSSRSPSGRPSEPTALACAVRPDGRRRHRAHRRRRSRSGRRARPPGCRSGRATSTCRPWLKGRYGTAVGRAVHGTLQTIDLATGAGLDAAVAAQCEAEAIPDRADQVRRARHRTPSRAPSVRAAAGARHWREVYACTPVDGRLLEGYIDLLYAQPTTASSSSTTRRRPPTTPPSSTGASTGYRLQGASYALTIAAPPATPVERVTFLFLTPTGPVERHLADLDAAVAQVADLVTAGHELTVDETEIAG